MSNTTSGEARRAGRAHRQNSVHSNGSLNRSFLVGCPERAIPRTGFGAVTNPWTRATPVKGWVARLWFSSLQHLDRHEAEHELTASIGQSEANSKGFRLIGDRCARCTGLALQALFSAQLQRLPQALTNWGLDPFGKQKLAYRLLKTFPGGGPLTASIWAIMTWMTGDRCLNELDCT